MLPESRGSVHRARTSGAARREPARPGASGGSGWCSWHRAASRRPSRRGRAAAEGAAVTQPAGRAPIRASVVLDLVAFITVFWLGVLTAL